MKQPVNGFANSVVATMFDPPKDTTEGIISQHPGTSRRNKTGAIIGGVMGAVSAIIGVTALAIWAVRRRSGKGVYEKPSSPEMEKSEKILHTPYSMEHQSPIQELPAEVPVAELSGNQGPYELSHSKGPYELSH